MMQGNYIDLFDGKDFTGIYSIEDKGLSKNLLSGPKNAEMNKGMEDCKAFYLPNGKKTCWFDCHRRFLPHNHPLRKNKKDFLKGKHALNDFPPESLTSEQVYSERLNGVNPPKTSKCGGNGHDKKKPGYGKHHN